MSCKKICAICGIEFEANTTGKYCSDKCRKIKNKKDSKKYYLKNSEKIKKRAIDWDRDNSDKRKNTSKIYAENNKEKIIKYRKEYYEKNKEKLAENSRKYYKENKEIKSEKARKYYKKNKDHIKKKSSEWVSNNKKRAAENTKNWARRNRAKKGVSLSGNISCQIRIGLKRKKGFKTFDLLGYTSTDLKNHLDSLFKDGMSWDNYGRFGWHIDHIKPIASFKLTKKNGEPNLEQIKLCWSLNNLQPLWANENESKGSWYEVDGKMCRFFNGEIVEIREDNS